MAAPKAFIIEVKQGGITISGRVEETDGFKALKKFWGSHILCEWLDTTIKLRRVEVEKQKA